MWVREGRILDPEKLFFEERRVADEQRDCGGCILAPGFIDVQINGAAWGSGWVATQRKWSGRRATFLCVAVGGFGVDFSQASEDVGSGVALVARRILSHGVTSFCPTLVTSPPEVYHKVRSSSQSGETGAPEIRKSVLPQTPLSLAFGLTCWPPSTWGQGPAPRLSHSVVPPLAERPCLCSCPLGLHLCCPGVLPSHTSFLRCPLAASGPQKPIAGTSDCRTCSCRSGLSPPHQPLCAL